MSATTYTLTVAGEAVRTLTTRKTLVAQADALRAGGERGEIVVVTDKGHESYVLPFIKTRVITRRTKAFTKVVDLPEALRAIQDDRYDVAYTRPLNDTAVLRKAGEADDSENPFLYKVTRLTTGEVLGYSPTTRGAGAIQTRMDVRKLAKAAAQA